MYKNYGIREDFSCADTAFEHLAGGVAQPEKIANCLLDASEGEQRCGVLRS